VAQKDCQSWEKSTAGRGQKRGAILSGREMEATQRRLTRGKEKFKKIRLRSLKLLSYAPGQLGRQGKKISFGDRAAIESEKKTDRVQGGKKKELDGTTREKMATLSGVDCARKKAGTYHTSCMGRKKKKEGQVGVFLS